jgi:hypothetical protein
MSLAGVAAATAVVAALGLGRHALTEAVSKQDGPTGTDLPWCEGAARSFAAVTAVGPRETVAVSTADLDGDGMLDALYTNQLDQNVTVRWGSRERDSGVRQEIATGRSAFPPQVIDVDHDGLLDMLVSLSDDAAFGVVRGVGGRRFATPVRIVQGPSPREAHVTRLGHRSYLVFVSGQELYRREITADLAWPPHERLGNIAPDGAPTVSFAASDMELFALVRTASLQLFAIGATGIVRPLPLPSRWAEMPTVIVARTGPNDAEELLGLSVDGASWRIPSVDDAPPCIIAKSSYGTQTIARLDGDDTFDAVGARTCSGCTSEHAVLFGQPR